MRRRRKSHQGSSHERWLISYADFITLLFAFFVVMFASSQIDRKKARQVAREIQTAFSELGTFDSSPSKILLPGGDGLLREETPVLRKPLDYLEIKGNESPAISGIEKELAELLKEQIGHQNISLAVRAEGLIISLRENGFFESGSASLRPEAARALESIAKTMADRSHSMRIEGHTDNVPIHTGRFDSNWELSTARATEIVKYFITVQKINPARLSAAGYGEFHPVVSNDVPEGRAMNRRVDIVILRRAEGR